MACYEASTCRPLSAAMKQKYETYVLVFRAQLCQSVTDTSQINHNRCSYGKRCCFAHGMEEKVNWDKEGLQLWSLGGKQWDELDRLLLSGTADQKQKAQDIMTLF